MEEMALCMLIGVMILDELTSAFVDVIASCKGKRKKNANHRTSLKGRV